MHLSSSILALSLALVSGSIATSIGPIANIPIVNRNIAPDGFSRSTVLAGGTFPGPLIKGFKGNRFLLNVEDKLTDNTMLRSTSIHWHGFFQRNTSWADGPSFVTQCPIAANHSFLYDFQAPGQAGTYWYHSHLSTQYCDGLRGPMVFTTYLTPSGSYMTSMMNRQVITLADWYHFPAPIAPAIPQANSTLINGLGRYQNGPASPLAVISVRKGKRYRFRLVAISCDPTIFSGEKLLSLGTAIDGHSLTIIEVDGVNHKPLTVDSLQIFAGQRYSFVLHADQRVANYWVRANPNLGITGFAGAINSAILRYAGAPTVEPTTNSTGTTPLVETALHPLVRTPVPGKPFPGGADVNLNLNIVLNLTSFKTFVPPTAPVLLQVLSGAQAAQDLLPSGSVYTLPPNKVIEISIPGGAPGAPHPFHLHGHNFHVIRSAGNATYNFDNPVIRDVVSTGPSTTDNATFRFVTDNAGPWFLHCHIDWHLEIGLAVVFAEDTGTLRKEKTPPAWDQLCPIYDNLKPDQL